jgi:NitT/TauT family transport system permease protein
MVKSLAIADSALPRHSTRNGNQVRRIVVFVVIVVGLVVLWEGAKVLFALPDYKLPHILSIFEALARPTPKGMTLWVLLGDTLYTGGEAVLGFVLGGVTGFLLAVLFVHVKPAERGLLPYVIASQTVPIIAIAPMIVVGIGRMGAPPWLAKSIIAAYLTFFPVTINALRGLTSVHQDQLALMHSYAASKAQIFFKVRLPASVPFLFTALKISATASVIGAIIGELPVGSARGLGVQLVIGSQYNTFNPGFLWATILMAALLGLVFYGVVALVERWVVRWRAPARED